MASRLPQELQKEVFELTLALYRVTDFFPKNDALRRSLREKANEIFGFITEYSHGERGENEALLIFARIETIKGYLDIARTMRLVKPVNLSVLYREYDSLGQFFKNESRLPSHLSPNTPPERWGGLSDIKNIPFSGDNKMSYREKDESVRDGNHTSHRKFSKGVKSSVSPIVDPVRGRPANPVRNTISNGAGATATTAPGRSASNGVDPIVDETKVSDFSRPVLDTSDFAKESRESLYGRSVRVSKDKNYKGHIGQKGESDSITERQKTIIGHIKKGSRKAKLSDIHALFADVSSKTIQRDLHDLVLRNILRKEGEKRWTTYFLTGG